MSVFVMQPLDSPASAKYMHPGYQSVTYEAKPKASEVLIYFEGLKKPVLSLNSKS